MSRNSQELGFAFQVSQAKPIRALELSHAGPDLLLGLRYALVWGKSSKFSPQPQKVSLVPCPCAGLLLVADIRYLLQVGLTHLVSDEDV
jgi:hypothetical protein